MDALLPLAAEACGWAGLAGACLWTFARSRAGMILVQLGSGLGFGLHWALQGHWTAAIGTACGLGLGVISLGLAGPPGSARLRLARAAFLLMLPAVALQAALTWAGWHSLFAGIGTAMGCLARWQRDQDRLRWILLASALPWLAHNALVGSVPAMAADLFCLGRAALEVLARRRQAAPRAVPAALPA